MKKILEVTQLCRSYPGFDLKDVNLQVLPGSIHGLIGPSGAGKTTLMKLVMGQIQPNCGRVLVSGFAHPNDLKEIRCKIGFVGEDPPFQPRKRVGEIGHFVGSYFPRWDATCFNDLLKSFEIDPRARVEELSRGRKTLLSWAIALSHEADLLLLDEPAAGLDAIKRRQVLALMAEFVADGNRSAVITTHYTEGLAQLMDRVAILHRGRVLLSEDTEELLASWKWLLYRNEALSAELESLLVSKENGAFGNRGLLQNFPLHEDHLEPGRSAGDIQIGNASIDDILVSLTEGK